MLHLFDRSEPDCGGSRLLVVSTRISRPRCMVHSRGIGEIWRQWTSARRRWGGVDAGAEDSRRVSFLPQPISEVAGGRHRVSLSSRSDTRPPNGARIVISPRSRRQSRQSRSRKSRKSALHGRRFPAEPITPDEVKALLQVCSNRAPTGIRSKALIIVFWRGGLRVQQALSLLPKDFDVEKGTLRVLHGKGDRARLVGIAPEAVAVVQRWLDKRSSLGLNGRHPLFCTLQGMALATVYVRNFIKRLARKAGIEKRVHPHGLRHAHAFELANEGTPLHVIQQQLGHSSLATTDRYVRHLNPQQVVEAMQARSWG